MMKLNEKEEPEENWTCITVVMIIGTIINLGIVIVVRSLLDSENEINEPLIQGLLRTRLTIFLYIFTMTFFFGCWFCCCCGCLPCSYLPECPSATGALITNMSHKFISSRPSFRRKFDEHDPDIEVDEVVVVDRSYQRPPLKVKASDNCAYENPVAYQDDITENDAVSNVGGTRPIPTKTPLGRMRSYSIDISYQ